MSLTSHPVARAVKAAEDSPQTNENVIVAGFPPIILQTASNSDTQFSENELQEDEDPLDGIFTSTTLEDLVRSDLHEDARADSLFKEHREALMSSAKNSQRSRRHGNFQLRIDNPASAFSQSDLSKHDTNLSTLEVPSKALIVSLWRAYKKADLQKAGSEESSNVSFSPELQADSSNDLAVHQRLVQGSLHSLGLKGSEGKGLDLPMHQIQPHCPGTGIGSSQPQLPPSNPADLIYLLVCYNKGKYEERLLQLDLTKLDNGTDKALSFIVRKSYYKLKRRVTRISPLRCLQGIQSVQFEMYKSELIELKSRNVYKYTPPETIPPIGTNYLMHVFQHPDCAEEEPLCLSRFCKGGIKPGWGLQLIEGWDARKLWLLGFLLFGLGSLTVGVLWTVKSHSIQDAFSIASYMLAFGAMTVGTVQAFLAV
ncbi:hypothetical protein MBM_02194 [Drepanopeziza brunnea f. sp. 'multigermtubi' MB_m1]|uniref:Uncharacterized protein n=1 Tax=Marssonina brunnea f. sp. multigermtubi (strain MB_m1) TaxID=1072389 RepID=K1X580_MARBU|nr:uncharacterized protein MBM_02194 [Drepanopeziza brunnea f. sp. 'multigermtubi' MB_m1]EKD20242.1 hypothetical protein MBM_02194 [Drepanopeziza brunnea f. sp. 'multigermtubi' MB_m1]